MESSLDEFNRANAHMTVERKRVDFHKTFFEEILGAFRTLVAQWENEQLSPTGRFMFSQERELHSLVAIRTSPRFGGSDENVLVPYPENVERYTTRAGAYKANLLIPVYDTRNMAAVFLYLTIDGAFTMHELKGHVLNSKTLRIAMPESKGDATVELVQKLMDELRPNHNLRAVSTVAENVLSSAVAGMVGRIAQMRYPLSDLRAGDTAPNSQTVASAETDETDGSQE